jgi:hypothetical protein
MNTVERPARRLVGWRWALTVPMVLAVVATAATAGAATVISETTWGGPDSEVTNGAAVGADGAAYLTGFTRSFDPFGQENVFLVRFAPIDGCRGRRLCSQPRHPL